MEHSTPESGQSRAETRRLREERWRRLLKEQRASGLGHTEFCRQRSISPGAYFWWKRELPQRDRSRAERGSGGAARHGARKTQARLTSLVPVRITAAARTAAISSSALELVLAPSRVVRIAPGFDPETLRRLVLLLEERC